MTEAVLASAAPLRVLLLDDDPFMLAMLGDILEEVDGDIDVRSERDARAALQALGKHRPELLICDLSMPEMDGIEFLRLTAESDFRGGVVLLSGMDQRILQAAEMLAMAQGLTILGACRKPLAAGELGDLVALARSLRQRPDRRQLDNKH